MTQFEEPGKGLHRRITQQMLDDARRILNLPEKATLDQIKVAYRAMALRYHPDKCPSEECKRMMRKINEAYELLMSFCQNYLYVFRVENTLREEDWEEWLDRFYPDF